MIKNEVKILGEIEHCLKLPGMFIGSVALEKNDGFIFNLNTQKFEYKSYKYIQGLFKIINEIIDNSLDEFKRIDYKNNPILDICIENNKITIKDNGRGIPIENITTESGKIISQLEASMTKLRAGGNFSNSDSNRTTIGMHGYGSCLTNIFSKEFQVKVQTATGKGKLICKDNLSYCKCIIDTESKSDKTYTEVSFLPDYERFGLSGIDDIHLQLLYTRL